MMAEALERWLREEMELPPSAIPSPAALRRLCSGPAAPIWDYVIRHVRNQRNVKKIRGNLRLYGHLQELEAAPARPGQQGALRAAVERLRKEVRDLGDAIADAQETAQRLDASLDEAQSRRWAELQRGAELRLLGAELQRGAEPGPAGLRDGHEGALRAIHKRPGQSREELSAILAAGAEPEVLVSIKALCKAREAELQRPHPHRAANHPGKAEEAPDWSEQAEAVLIGHSPEAVLWALEVLANQSTRALLAGPTPSAEAPPTLKSLLQLHLQQRLRFLSAATRGRRAALKPLQEQVVGVVQAGPGLALPPLEGAWLRRRQLALGALGALGEEPRPPAQATPPLRGLAREMGVAQGLGGVAKPAPIPLCPSGLAAVPGGHLASAAPPGGAAPAPGGGACPGGGDRAAGPTPPHRGCGRAAAPAAIGQRRLRAANQGLAPPPGARQPMVGPAGSVGPGHAPWLRPLLPLAAALERRRPRLAGHAHPRGGPTHPRGGPTHRWEGGGVSGGGSAHLKHSGGSDWLGIKWCGERGMA
ncbi:HAUS augmin-like complex subunit 5 [Melozone crissalis]|uniref:HAUS augmin-like complex subunit 5 n=1 Tax=Melozone crissalis TaxID=40204 RepID=UPI0023DAAB9F|nr:HAUS augmin-like complex subunit 5 [Melozone crissalis]